MNQRADLLKRNKIDKPLAWLTKEKRKQKIQIKSEKKENLQQTPQRYKALYKNTMKYMSPYSIT